MSTSSISSMPIVVPSPQQHQPLHSRSVGAGHIKTTTTTNNNNNYQNGNGNGSTTPITTTTARRTRGTNATTVASSTTTIAGTSCVDDAKYDRRLKHTILSQNRHQRQQRRHRMRIECQQYMLHRCCGVLLLLVVVGVIIVVATTILVFFMVGYNGIWWRTSSLSSSSSSLPLPQQQEQGPRVPQPQTQPQRLPPLLQQKQQQLQQPPELQQPQPQPMVVVPLSSTTKATLELQYQQLRALVYASENRNGGSIGGDSDQHKRMLVVRQQKQQLIDTLTAWLEQEDSEIQANTGDTTPRFTRPYLLPPIQIMTTSDDPTTKNQPQQMLRTTNQRQPPPGLFRQKNNYNNNNQLPMMKGVQLGSYFRVHRFPLPTNFNRGNPPIPNLRNHNMQWKTKKRYEQSDNNNNNNDPEENNGDGDERQQSDTDKDGTTTNAMKWQDEYDALIRNYGSIDQIPGPSVDYTDPNLYDYQCTTVLDSDHHHCSSHPSPPPMDGSYPKLQSLQQLLSKWPQNEDYPTITRTDSQPGDPGDGDGDSNSNNGNNNNNKIPEVLLHFDYQNVTQLAMARLYRDAELPFKLYNVPDITRATKKWKNDDYVGQMFGPAMSSSMSASESIFGLNSGAGTTTILDEQGDRVRVPTARGTAQESRDHYFAFYVAKQWDVESMGLAPTRNIVDWNYTIWSQHAVYADAVRLSHDKPHFYWQSGVPPEERHQSPKYYTFISRDLPIFSTTTDNFFVFNVNEQKGIQCRFGERGVVAATHFDSGRNMIAMITGAKRYILSPPNQCSKLGIFKSKRSPIYRHSLLNFGHIEYLEQEGNDEADTTSQRMSPEERAWLQRAASSQAVETVLKAGEVLYIPSHWFHYIISLQKSAQCNVRSGVDVDGTSIFGGRKEVEECTE